MKEITRTDTIPFESQHKYMVTRHEFGNKQFIDYIKWAPEKILPLMSFIDKDGKEEKLTQQKQKEIEEKYEKLTSTWLRVIAVWYRKWVKKSEKLKKDWLKDFVFIWLIALKDPLRQEVKRSYQALSKCLNDIESHHRWP